MRKKVELLAPAGSFEALRSAVQNGCDAVYLGGRSFGARAFADNFDEEELKRAVSYAHVYGVRVFVTVNTLVYEEELSSLIDYVKLLQAADVDALIVQDLGVFSLLRRLLPDMELHASTQMHIHNKEGIRMMKREGATRVVVPREMALEEIRELAKLGIDLEVFVQGALCVSYSGQCLMSSLTLQRSGNRGACAQSCRMQYVLEKEEDGKRSDVPAKGSYLLSPKDMNTLAYVPQLIEAGIASFKIEGRMKRPEYVALMTSLYRKAIDAYVEGKKFSVEKEVLEEMQKIFHRGFTSSHLFHQKGSALMNPLRPNHVGIDIGVVEQVRKGRITIRLHHELTQGDGIRILQSREDAGFCANRIYQNGLLVKQAKAGESIQLESTQYVEKGSRVLKTSDVEQLERLRASYEAPGRTCALQGSFSMRINELPCLRVKDERGNVCEVYSEAVCEEARTTPLTRERIEQQLRKTKDTPFVFSSLQIDAQENSTFPIRELNRMRREALRQMEEKRAILHPHRRIMELERDACPVKKKEERLMAVVHTKEQYDVCRAEGISYIYVEGEALYAQVCHEENTYLREARVKKDAYTKKDALIQENGGLAFIEHGTADTSLNITNSYAAAFAFTHGADVAVLSLEHTKESIAALCQGFFKAYGWQGNFAVQVYGHAELMLSEYCPINACIKDNDKKGCALCRGKASYALRDLKGRRYPIMTDMHCRMHLLSEEPLYKTIKEYTPLGITSFLCVFTKESPQECRGVLQRVKEELYGEG